MLAQIELPVNVLHKKHHKPTAEARVDFDQSSVDR
jgi:hypothetical protein